MNIEITAQSMQAAALLIGAITGLLTVFANAAVSVANLRKSNQNGRAIQTMHDCFDKHRTEVERMLQPVAAVAPILPAIAENLEARTYDGR